MAWFPRCRLGVTTVGELSRLPVGQVGDPQDFREMLTFIGEKRIKPVIERTFMLAEAPDALLHLQGKHRFGKVVIRI